MTKHPNAKAILRVVVPYAVFASLWILLSDKLLEALVTGPADFARISTYKGWAFVLVTALLLAYLLRVQLRKRRRAFARLEERVAARTRELADTTRFLDAILDNIPNPVF